MAEAISVKKAFSLEQTENYGTGFTDRKARFRLMSDIV